MKNYKFMKYLELCDVENPYTAGRLKNLPEVYTGDFYISEKTKEIEILINIDSKRNIENFMSKNEELTQEIQDSFELSSDGSWLNFREKWVKEKSFLLGNMGSGNTYNLDNGHFWGSGYEYTHFFDPENKQKNYVIIQWHIGGDVRCNYEYPVIYSGDDFENFFCFENIDNTKDEIAYLLGYDGDGDSLYADFESYINYLTVIEGI